MAKLAMKTMLKGALILTIASFISKILSAIYRVPFQNMVGNQGFYVYQQAYPIYGIAMTLALTGFPQFISKYLAEVTDPLEQARRLQKIYPFIFYSSVFFSLILVLFSPLIARVMGDSQLIGIIQITALTFVFVPVLSLYRGTYQSHLLMLPSAYSQVGEQIVRVGIILFAAYCYKWLNLTTYQTAQWAMSGALLGAVLAFVLLKKAQYRWQLATLFPPLLLPYFSQPKSWLEKMKRERHLLKRLITEGGILTMYTGYLILFQLIDAFVIVNALKWHGYSLDFAQNLKGIYDRGQPLVQLGLVIAGALSASFLPNLTRFVVLNKTMAYQRMLKIFLRLVTCFSLAATFGLLALLPWMNQALFKDNAGNQALSIFVLSIALMSMIQAYQSVDQSKNRYLPAFKAGMVGLVSKLILTIGFTRYFSIEGASVGTIVALIIVLVILIGNQALQLNVFWLENGYWWKMCLCIGSMYSVVFSYRICVENYLLPINSRFALLLLSILGVVLGVVVFISLALRLRLFTVREWLLLPGGKYLLKLFSKRGEKACD